MSGILFIILSYSCLPFSPAIVFVGIWLIIDIFLLPMLVKSANSVKHIAVTPDDDYTNSKAFK